MATLKKQIKRLKIAMLLNALADTELRATSQGQGIILGLASELKVDAQMDPRTAAKRLRKYQKGNYDEKIIEKGSI